MIGFPDFPRRIQLTDYTCGPCSVHAVTSHYGLTIPYEAVKQGVRCDEEGTDETWVVKFLRSVGFRVCIRGRLKFRGLLEALERAYVVLVSLDGDHYGVVYGYDEDAGEVLLSDPSVVRQLGRRIARREFMKRWDRDGLLIRQRRSRVRVKKNGGSRCLVG